MTKDPLYVPLPPTASGHYVVPEGNHRLYYEVRGGNNSNGDKVCMVRLASS